jgi:L-cysteine:1D-myo-inositol 2-amino-2-deoxy-alpha-D-glucopyranoside ligase
MESWPHVRVPKLAGHGPELRLRDTATGELAVAAAGHEATMYACGITPYDSTHIGHAATFTAWDLIVRAWLDAGHDVTYVQNVTDVDDPLLERAARNGEDWRHLADREITRYREDMTALRLLPPSYLIGAVEALPLIERFTGRLTERGALYELDGDLYFARSADPSFGCLSKLDNQAMTALTAERGGDPGRPGKKDPLDALVWLAARPGEPSWESPYGPGRPGWHVECAAIATEYLGAVFDLQVGGCDLIFPHHEMSASHARVALSAGGAPSFARRYAHAGMVRFDGEKMSKSRGNLVFVSDLLAGGVDPAAIRLALLVHHYRSDWDWTDAGLAAATRRLGRWRAAVRAAGRSGVPGSAGATDGPGPLLAGQASGGSAGAPRSAGSGGATGSAGSGGATGSAISAGSAGATGSAGSFSEGAREVLVGVRERLADDLDAPGALAWVDRWADGVLADGTGRAPAADGSGEAVRDLVDALLGVAL